MKNFLCLLLIFGLGAPLTAQTLSGVSARWSDSFVEWELYAKTEYDSTEAHDSEGTDEELYGELKLRWLNLRDDWTEWDFTLGAERGTIRLKWKDDPTQWELRTYSGAVVTMRAAWNNDLSEWRVTDNDVTLIWRSRWTSQADEWVLTDSARGMFYLYTVYEGDPRDWVIDDQLDTSVSEPMKMAMIFLTVFHSTPRM